MKRPELKDLANYYDSELCGNCFRYKVKNHSDIQVNFYRENLCHLLGIQHITHKRKYLGASGYDMIHEGKLTTEKLILYDKKKYNFIKSRMEHFTEIRDLLQCPKLYKFYQERVYPPTRIQADFVFHEDKCKYRLHLFVTKETMNNENLDYSPDSFVVKSVSDPNANQYIDRQEYKCIEQVIITPKKVE